MVRAPGNFWEGLPEFSGDGHARDSVKVGFDVCYCDSWSGNFRGSECWHSMGRDHGENCKETAVKTTVKLENQTPPKDPKGEREKQKRRCLKYFLIYICITREISR